VNRAVRRLLHKFNGKVIHHPDLEDSPKYHLQAWYISIKFNGKVIHHPDLEDSPQ
jgi:hypothetical protein